MAILIGNLSSEVTQTDLENLFTEYEYVTVQKINLFPTGGYAVVEIEEGKEQEKYVIQSLSSGQHFGQQLQLFMSATEDTDEDVTGTRGPVGHPAPPTKPKNQPPKKG